MQQKADVRLGCLLARSLCFHGHIMSRCTNLTGETLSWSRRQSDAAAQLSTHPALCFGSCPLRTRHTGTSQPLPHCILPSKQPASFTITTPCQDIHLLCSVCCMLLQSCMHCKVSDGLTRRGGKGWFTRCSVRNPVAHKKPSCDTPANACACHSAHSYKVKKGNAGVSSCYDDATCTAHEQHDYI